MGEQVTAKKGFFATLGLGQGLALVHFSAQLEPCLTQENTLNTPFTWATRLLRAPPIP
jgi:hypothetical protein